MFKHSCHYLLPVVWIPLGYMFKCYYDGPTIFISYIPMVRVVLLAMPSWDGLDIWKLGNRSYCSTQTYLGMMMAHSILILLTHRMSALLQPLRILSKELIAIYNLLFIHNFLQICSCDPRGIWTWNLRPFTVFESYYQSSTTAGLIIPFKGHSYIT